MGDVYSRACDKFTRLQRRIDSTQRAYDRAIAQLKSLRRDPGDGNADGPGPALAPAPPEEAPSLTAPPHPDCPNEPNSPAEALTNSSARGRIGFGRPPGKSCGGRHRLRRSAWMSAGDMPGPFSALVIPPVMPCRAHPQLIPMALPGTARHGRSTPVWVSREIHFAREQNRIEAVNPYQVRAAARGESPTSTVSEA